MGLFAQLDYGPLASRPGSPEMLVGLVATLVVGFGLFFALMKAPTRSRRWIVNTVTFLAGLFYILYWAWPHPVNRKPDELPRNFVENVGFGISDTLPLVASISNILTAFLLGLGIYSLMRIHIGRIAKRQPDR